MGFDINDFMIAYVDHDVKYGSGILHEIKHRSSGLTSERAMVSAINDFTRDHPTCSILRIRKHTYQSQLDTLDKMNGQPVTGAGFVLGIEEIIEWENKRLKNDGSETE